MLYILHQSIIETISLSIRQYNIKKLGRGLLAKGYLMEYVIQWTKHSRNPGRQNLLEYLVRKPENQYTIGERVERG